MIFNKLITAKEAKKLYKPPPTREEYVSSMNQREIENAVKVLNKTLNEYLPLGYRCGIFYAMNQEIVDGVMEHFPDFYICDVRKSPAEGSPNMEYHVTWRE